MATYPFTLHFDGAAETRSVSKKPWRLIKGEPVFASTPAFSMANLDSVRDAFDQLLTTSQEYDYVATFALGGVTPLIYITTALSDGTAAITAINYRDLQRRFHLFAGPNWEFNTLDNGEVNPQSVTTLFSAWLNGLHANSRILVFDTGNIGNGANRAYNMVRGHFQNPTSVRHECVLVCGLVSLTHQGNWVINQKRENIELANGSTTEIEKVPLPVSSNMFEDVANLIGYDSLRDLGMVRPLKSSQSLLVTKADGTLVGLGTSNLAGQFYGLLRRNMTYRLWSQNAPVSTPMPQEAPDVEQP